MSTCDASEGRRARHERKPSRARRGHAGFTLIEVLAAVALLGILYSVLARVAIEGLRAEGESERRLEASLLADERLSAVIGPPLPPLGHVETTEGDFKIAIDVTPFQMPTQWGNGIFEVPEPLLLAAAPNGHAQRCEACRSRSPGSRPPARATSPAPPTSSTWRWWPPSRRRRPRDEP